MTELVAEKKSKYPRVPMNEQGEQVLAKGGFYFLDVDSDEDFAKAHVSLAKLPLRPIGKPLRSGRANVLESASVMAAYEAQKDVLIPRSLGQFTGRFRIMNGNSLPNIQRDFYGDMYDTPADWWEHISNANPALFNFTRQGAQKVKEVAEGLTDTAKLLAAAAVLGVFVAVLMYTAKRLPSSDNDADEETEEWENES